MVDDAPVKVVLVAGLPRSGTTIVGHLLGQVEDFFFAGELVSVADAFARDKHCGCGVPIRTCEVWRDIRMAVGDSTEQPFATTAVPWRDASAAAVVRHMIGLGRGRTAQAERAIVALLRGIRTATGAQVVVDSSKGPGYAALLARRPEVDLTLVHIVREPAAIVVSRQNRSARIGRPDYLSTRELGLMWTLWNPALELVQRRGRYMRLPYASFAAAPREALDRVVRLTAMQDRGLPFLNGNVAQVEATHSVRGNRSRFGTGELTIAADEAWRTRSLSRRDRVLLGALTAPARLRYKV